MPKPVKKYESAINPHDLFTELASVSSSIEKKEILTKGANGYVTEAIRWALDPNITFGVKQYTFDEPCEHGEEYDFNLQLMYHALGKLASREITGNNALELIKVTSCQLNTSQQQVFKRILDKDLRCGVGLTIVGEIFPDLIARFKVMLADNKPLDFEKIQYPVRGEPKLDGVRCEGIISGKEVSFLSRNGKPFPNFGCFADELIAIADGQDLIFDGEVSGVDEEQAFKRAQQQHKRKHNVDTSKLKYSIFDVIIAGVNETQRQRSKRLKDMFKSKSALARKIKRVFRVIGKILHNREELELYYKECLDAGYEGIIIKNLDALYQQKRTKDWKKLKPNITVDVKVIGCKGGKEGKYENTLGALIVDYKGVKVSVSGMSDLMRDKLWKMHLAKKLAGITVEVKFDAETEDGSMRFPRVKMFKDSVITKQRFDKEA